SLVLSVLFSLLFFCFHAPATPDIYTLSLHDALPISVLHVDLSQVRIRARRKCGGDLGLAVRIADGFVIQQPLGAIELVLDHAGQDRKSTRLNSSHVKISYAVFCLKKKKNKRQIVYTK